MDKWITLPQRRFFVVPLPVVEQPQEPCDRVIHSPSKDVKKEVFSVDKLGETVDKLGITLG